MKGLGATRWASVVMLALLAGCGALPERPAASALADAATAAHADAGPAAAAPGATATITGDATPVVVRILALNDLHGQIEPPGSFRASASSPAVAVGGVDVLAAYVAQARAANPRTLVVSAGDLIGATPLVSALFHDEPTIEAMNRAGLDFNAVGNHEFDDGVNELLRMQHGGCHASDPGHSCRGAEVGTPVPFEGARFGFLAANVVRRADGQTLFPPYGVRRFEVAGREFKLAVIGLTLKGTDRIVSPAGIRSVRFEDEAASVNALLPRLRAEGVGAIVVLIHQGGVQSGAAPADINGCAGDLAGSPIKAIVGRLDDAVDLVVSGHTHAAYNCRLPLASKRLVPVTSAHTQGRVLSDIALSLDPRSGRVASVVAVNRLVAREAVGIAPDPAVAAIVGSYRRLSAPLANGVIGAIARELPNSRDAACNMPAGELIADSQLAATAAPERGGAQLALMNPGGVRSPGFVFAGGPAGEGDGNVTYGEAFSVQPFGNSLVTMTLTTQQLREVLEQQFPGCFGQTGYARVLLPSAGLRYEWDATRACGDRLRSASLSGAALVDAQGRVVAPQRRWRVTVNSYLAEGGDGFTQLTEGTERSGGGQDLAAMVGFLAAYKSPQAPYDPRSATQGRARIVRVDGGTSCP